MPMKSSSQATKSSAMSSFMCCTSERSSKTIRYREQNQSKYLWLDPTRWVEKKSKREEVCFIIRFLVYDNVILLTEDEGSLHY